MGASLRAERPRVRMPVPTPAGVLPTRTRRPAVGHCPRRLTFGFYRQSDGFTLDVAWRTEARRLCILGASGSGKSATLRLIAGVDQAAKSSLLLAGQDLTSLPPHLRRVGYVPQSYALLPHLSVHQQVRFGAGAEERLAAYWTQRLGLAGLAHRLPAELSLGQQQRVALARALSRPSELLLLDEPFSALDAPLRAGLREELWALQDEIAATTILVTHDPAEAMLLADEVLLLEGGHVLQAGPVSAVFQRPASQEAAALLGAENLALGHAVSADQIDLGGVRIAVGGPVLPAGPVGWSVRRTSIRLVAEGGYPAAVLAVGEPRAGQRSLTLQLGGVVLQALAEPGHPPALGACRVAIDPAAIQVWPKAAIFLPLGEGRGEGPKRRTVAVAPSPNPLPEGEGF